MKKAQNGVTEAIKAQKEKRAAIQAKSDAKKEEAIAPRRAKGLPASKPKSNVTKAPAKGSDITKYMKKEDPIKKNVQRNTQIKSANEYYDKLAGNKKKTTPVKKAIDRSSVAAPIKASVNRNVPSGMSKPSSPGISAKPVAKQYSKKEGKQMIKSKNKAGRVAKRTAIRAIRRGK